MSLIADDDFSNYNKDSESSVKSSSISSSRSNEDGSPINVKLMGRRSKTTRSNKINIQTKVTDSD